MNRHPRKETHLHFVGIGGIGMSGIAEVLFNQGYKVSGSDQADSETTRRLKKLGLKIFIGHDPQNVENSQVVVISSAVRSDNVEVVAARKRSIPVIPRAEMLGEIMWGKTGIAVAGSHGKTTTTSLLATILTEGGLDPTIVIGGKVDSLGGNAKLGNSDFVVAEADESDGSFLHLPAMYGIITNIDNDHLDHFGSLEKVDQAFVDFVTKLPFYGVAAVCGEDPGVQRCLNKMMKPIITYGLSKKWDWYATDIQLGKRGACFKVYWREGSASAHQLLGEFELGIPGKHNVLNALGAIVIASKLEVPYEAIRDALNTFGGVSRRFEVCWKSADGRKVIVDDYGHHPTEITATLEAAKNFWKGRVISIFQPHRFSRTLHCKDGFLSSFRKADVVLVTDIYPAGEEPIAGIDAKSLVKEMQATAQPGQTIEYAGDLKQAKQEVLNLFKTGDLLLCLGAGSITRLARELTQEVESERTRAKKEDSDVVRN